MKEALAFDEVKNLDGLEQLLALAVGLEAQVRDASLAKPHVHAGSFVKAGIRGERFWCRVESVRADGMLRATVDNDLLRSAWRRGHVLVLQHEHVLEVADVADQLSFKTLAATFGSDREAALAWRGARVTSRSCRPKPCAWLTVPPR